MEQSIPIQINRELSVIIVTWNCRDDIIPCLDSLNKVSRNINLEVIIVDNASGDDTLHHISELFPDVIIIANKENKGFAEGCNQGLRKAKGQFLLLLNPDTIVNLPALKETMDFLRNNKPAGCAAPRLLHPDGLPQKSAYAYPGVWTYICDQSLLSPLIEKFDKFIFRSGFKKAEFKEPVKTETYSRKVVWLMGAFIMIKREIWEQVGELDAGYFMYSEDADWCLRMHKQGWDCFYLPNLNIIHNQKGTSSKRKHFTYVRIYKSMLRLYEKHTSKVTCLIFKGMVIIDLIVRLLIYGGLYCLSPKKRESLREKIRAVRDILKIYLVGNDHVE